MARLIALILPLLLIVGCGQGETITKRQTIVQVVDGDFNPVRIYKRAAPAVATVVPARNGKPASQGSGFLLAGGILATNAHVVLTEDGRPYREFYVHWQSGDRTSAKLVLVDPDTDLAILQTPSPSEATPLRLSRRQEVSPGEPVAAIGSPFGEPQSLSTGTVSAVGRSVQSLSRFQISDAIQTDASINPGNSGGPLLDSSGEVIGINQQIQTSSGGNDGVGYAVPAERLQRLISFARRGKEPENAYIGVSTQEVWPQLARRTGLPPGALLLADVVQGGPADRAGLRPGRQEGYFQGSRVILGGDAILKIDGKWTLGSEQLNDVLDGLSPGDRVPLLYLRKGKKQVTVIKLGSRPE